MALLVPTLILYFLMIVDKTWQEEIVNPIVKTSNGRVMGRFIKSYDNKTCIAFEGIPYAKPPVGKLRFKEPQPPNPWSNILVVNRTYVCPQVVGEMIMGEEDCLYVYVYVPMDKITGNENLHVVAHIHGGGFNMGFPKLFLSPRYLLDRNLLFVSFNYRLGIFGFLSTQDDVVPGNNGLKDQILALKWIKDNIKQFGGNPNSVTIIGLSAGGASVHFHYLSPMSKGLFHRGISQSGCALNPWALEKDPIRYGKKFATYFNCSTISSNKMVECLREISNSTILDKLVELSKNATLLVATFLPVIENGAKPFLPDHPYKLLLGGKFHDVPWVASHVKDEMLFFLRLIIKSKKVDFTIEHWSEGLTETLLLDTTVDEKDKAMIVAKINDYYFHNKSVSMDNIQQVISLLNDRMYFYDGETALRLQAKTGNSSVYYYRFEYLLGMDANLTDTIPGAAHGDDGRLMYNKMFAAKRLSEADREMKDILADFLFEFATTGKPKMKGVEWKRLTHREFNYMRVRSPGDIQMEVMKEMAPRKFWDSLPIKENAHLYKDDLNMNR